jgi:hypothetical protein
VTGLSSWFGRLGLGLGLGLRLGRGVDGGPTMKRPTFDEWVKPRSRRVVSEHMREQEAHERCSQQHASWQAKATAHNT